MSDLFKLGFQYFFSLANVGQSNASSLDTVCTEGIDHYLFYQYSLIPATILCLLFAATKTRRQLLQDKLAGRPGLVFPMDTLTRATSFSYACAYGVTVSVVYSILLDQQFAVRYTGPIALQTLIAICSMFIYGMVFFPVFASLALASAFSYGLGSLYVWMFFIIEIYKASECDYTASGRVLVVVKTLPNLLCLAYLSASLPVRFVLAFRARKFFSSPLDEKLKMETLEEIKGSYQGIHVCELLVKPVKKTPPVGKWNIIRAFINRKIHHYIYHRKKGFEYPSRLVSVMFVAGCVVYVVTVEFLVFFVNLFNDLLDSFDKQLDSIGRDPQPNESSATAMIRDASNFGYYITYIVKVSTIVSITLSNAMSILIILHMMTSYRRNLYALYRGDFTSIPQASYNSAMGLCVGSMKFAGYQVAYIFWAYVMSVIVLFIICIILAFLIILLSIGISDWLVDTVLQVWPGVLIAIVLYVVQMLLAKFVFLQDGGEYLRLDNRRVYFIFTYFIFFFNIFMGMISCLMRIIKAIGIGIVFLARLDNSTLPRKFEFFDPGFSAYHGFIHMEATHTHPVVNVFIRLITSMNKARKAGKQTMVVNINTEVKTQQNKPGRFNFMRKKADKYKKVEHKPLNIKARFNWYLIYTLLHNPMIRMYRKGYIQALRKARKEGFKIPISDKFFTEFDLVKSKEDLEKEKQEELKKIEAVRMKDYEESANTLRTQVGPDGFEMVSTETDQNYCRDNSALDTASDKSSIV